MIIEYDRAYYLRREAAERQLADEAVDYVMCQTHTEQADLYLALASQATLAPAQRPGIISDSSSATSGE